MLKKLMENKALKIIGNILYYLLVVIIVLILVVVLVQRITNNNVSIAGIRIFNIVTESMVPKYQVGDILVSKSIDPSQIKVGDDLVYLGAVDSFQGKIVTHQVVDIEEENGQYKFHTKGIANEEEDPVVSESQVYGIIIYKTHILSFISKIINNLYGFYFLIFVPLAILIIVKIIKIYREYKESKEEDEEEQEVNEKSAEEENTVEEKIENLTKEENKIKENNKKEVKVEKNK
ncbi:MAG: signal peptidase I [Clostridia bacterium]